MDRVRVGIIGTGGVFRGAHLEAYPQIPEAQIVALCDVSRESRDKACFQLKKLYQEKAIEYEEKGDTEGVERLRKDAEAVKIYSDMKEMLDKEGLDLVDLCTPAGFHANIAVQLLKRGIHVMCEKPMAKTWLDCLEVLETVEKTGKFYQHNEQWIFSSGWYNAKKFIDAGAIGELQMMFIEAAHGGPEWETWFWDPEVAGGGALLDNGIHALTTAWFLAGFEKKPVMVKAVEPYGLSIRMKTRILKGRFSEFLVEDDAHVAVRFEDHQTGSWVTAHVEGSWSHRDSMETAMIGSNGMIRFDSEDGKVVLRITDPFGHERRITLEKSSGFYGEIRNMVKCVIDGVKPMCDEKIGADSTAIVGAAYLSQLRGRKAAGLDEFKDFALKLKEREGANASRVLMETLLSGVAKRRA